MFGANNNIIVNVPANHSVPVQPSISEQLHELHKLKEKGIISEEEYAIKKSKVLA
jgi:hypothetical protein